MERETGFEPATSSLGSWHSTTELLPPFGHPATYRLLNNLSAPGQLSVVSPGHCLSPVRSKERVLIISESVLVLRPKQGSRNTLTQECLIRRAGLFVHVGATDRSASLRTGVQLRRNLYTRMAILFSGATAPASSTPGLISPAS